MPPKKGNKKGRKNDDDDFWENAGETVTPNNSEKVEEDAPEDGPSRTGGFAGLAVEGQEVEEEDFGGLMSAIKKSNAKVSKKDKKKGKKKVEDEDLQEVTEVQHEDSLQNKGPIEVTAEDLADEEWAPSAKKKGKGQSGKDKTSKTEEDEAEDKDSTGQPAPDDEGGGETRILSKKEKEKLKKEREKAKKKEAAAKKKAELDAIGEAAPVAATTPVLAPPVDEGGDDEDEGGPADNTAKDKDKKKKKKKKPAEEEKKPAAPKKVSAQVAALRAAMEAQRLAQEEEARRQEEERRRIEEEERKAAEEAKRIEEEKKRRKEKEKAKKELAKKEGRLLTDKQKKQRAAAEIQRKALEASGVIIEGLQQKDSQSSSGQPKRVVYGNKKKKGPPNQKYIDDARTASPSTTRPTSPTSGEPHPAETEPAAEKEDWELSESEVPAEGPPDRGKLAPDVKDEWDADSEEEMPSQLQKDEIESKEAAHTNVAKPAHRPNRETNVQGNTVVNSVTSKNEVINPPSKQAPESADEDEEELSDEESDDSEETESDEELTATQRAAEQKKAEAAARRAKRREEALAARSKDDLRSPICCILGHVDTGKTKLLDKIRQTNVQEGEAGGITQQIGATYFPVEAIKQKTEVLNTEGTQEYKIPGLLIIDTPGHESFTNLRSRGSSLCNIAVLVVDIMHGLEPQTLESLRLLRDRKTPFIVALNKIDRMYGWEAIPNNAFRDSLAKQKVSVKREFEKRVQDTTVAFAEQGLNAVLYYENKNFARNVSLVPTSAITGEGVPDMIMLLVNLTQQRLSESLMYLSELECTVLEVKVIEGLGTTIDVVLSNGILREGDRIVVCGLNGPIVTQVRALLTPQPLRELRIKSAYVHHKEVKAALGVKIAAPDLEKAIAGSRLLVVGPDDDEEDLKDEVMSDLTSLLNSIDKSGRGVCVQSSTLGSLEALLDFLKVSKIPVSGINIGPVHKKDVMRSATMLEKAKELACILCFDVPVDKDAEKMAEEMGIRLFKADIIYHLFDAFTAYNQEIVEAKRRDAAPQAIWPCRLRIIAAFAKRDPIILGVDIVEGSLKIGTPLCVVKTDAAGKKEIIDLGKITSLEINHKAMEVVKKSQAGAGVAVKIEHAVYQSAKMFGRHFDDKDEVISHITRTSIDVLKDSFRKDVTKEEWVLITQLKPLLGIT
ncbi:hypothetical protein FRC02_000142 [Tulasnella sp. 418]|nr:hypothetical protein FRC02_000142 [Tulasnella sp. 418]